MVPGGPPPAVTDLGIARSREDVVLTWSPPGSKAAARRIIYRDTGLEFMFVSGDSIGSPADTIDTDFRNPSHYPGGFFFTDFESR